MGRYILVIPATAARLRASDRACLRRRCALSHAAEIGTAGVTRTSAGDIFRYGTADAMNRDDEDSEREDPRRGEGPNTEVDEVRAVMDHTREALESSAAELERAKRLLRETAKAVGGEEPVDDEPSGGSGRSG